MVPVACMDQPTTGRRLHVISKEALRGDLWSDYPGIVMHNRFGPDWSRMATLACALQALREAVAKLIVTTALLPMCRSTCLRNGWRLSVLASCPPASRKQSWTLGACRAIHYCSGCCIGWMQ